ncbi:MAG TPA: prolyl oligopeptidase family serine peptidase [Anaerolineales bacterium]|nr:prolyl oligopeptidase family serine peptidase [Anaerolineales bacterium]
MKITYPNARTVEQIDNYHGTIVRDPYRWLEDVDAPETLEWIQQQNKLTFSILEKIPTRETIRKRLTELWNYSKAWAPHKKGRWYFQQRNSGLQNQNVLYVMASLKDEPRVLLDPNTLSPDGTVALTSFAFSRDGNWLAYATSASGSDWLTWRVRNVETGQDLDEVIEWSKFCTAAWMPDGSGFYYSRYDAPVQGNEFQNINDRQKVFFHKLYTPAEQDLLVYERPDQKEWGFQSHVTDDGRYHGLTVWQGSDIRNRFFYRKMQHGNEFVELISELEATYELIGNDGTTLYFFTNYEAPRGKLIAIDIDHPQKENWKTLIPEQRAVLEGVIMVHDQFAVLYNEDAHHVLRLFHRDGTPDGDVPFPALGSVVQITDLGLRGSREDNELFYAFQSFLYPTTVYRYSFETRSTEPLNSPELDFDPTGYETEQVFVPSKDGTQIPIYLTHKKGLLRDGQNPTLLYAYGGFNISIMPAFAVSILAWIELGGVFASANLRGGGEYGQDWHQAGMLHNKQNVFDDFIACAEWLIAERITSTPKLAIQGGSNGGLLVGACMTQRPELYGACIPQVGVMDMLRFHKFTIGWAWVSDYGSPDDPEQFKTLYAYSPYHNLKPGTAYPPTLITTADHDDRVVPGHSFKFAARLQACQSGEAPVLIRIQTKAGHGFGKPTAIQIEEISDIYAFLVQSLKI